MKINNTNSNYSITTQVIYPIIKLGEVSTSINKSKQRSSYIKIPINFMLTINENYCIVELAFILGLRITILLKEK